ncbi:Maf family protein, partial [Alphaproteobacteria bacterium]|nr:Maf family protein [Alphaproteobacteria bacterium]
NSASRKRLLKNAGLNFFTKSPLCDEDYIKDQLLKKNINKKKLPKLLAEAKALSVSKKKTKHLVVGSDTIILFKNKIINKAKTIDEAKIKLQKLSGKKHQIISGASVCLNNKEIWSYQQTSTIYMKALNQKQINTYLKKAGKNILSSVGCYQVEKLGPQIIKSINGDFFNVLGFPLFPFLSFLSKR